MLRVCVKGAAVSTLASTKPSNTSAGILCRSKSDDDSDDLCADELLLPMVLAALDSSGGRVWFGQHKRRNSSTMC